MTDVVDARYALTAAVTLQLVTTRTLVTALKLLGIEWSPVICDKIPLTSETGLYTWTSGPVQEEVDPLDQPVIYVGIGTSRSGGLYGRLRTEKKFISESAAHAHGRAMFRLQASPLGGPVRKANAVNLSLVRKAILKTDWPNKEYGFQCLQEWLQASSPDILHKAEQLCIRAAVHIGDTPPPLNSHHAGAWGKLNPNDWGGWAVAQVLAAPKSASQSAS